MAFFRRESEVESFRRFVDSLLNIVIQLGHLIVAALVAIELWLRDQLALAGVPPVIQTVLLIAFAALLIVGSLRLFGGLIRVAVVLVLVLFAIHIIMPVLPA